MRKIGGKELGNAGIDIGTDAVAAAIPFVPAGATKVARVVAKNGDKAVDVAKAAKRAAKKKRDIADAASANADEAAEAAKKANKKPRKSTAESAETVVAPKKRGKPGPSTNKDAPHNKKIREEADTLEAEGHTIVAGGGRKKERLIRTPGGKKGGRRPDILHKNPDGELGGRNIGRTKADGTPKPREVDALDDLNERAKLPTDFVPYDR